MVGVTGVQVICPQAFLGRDGAAAEQERGVAGFQRWPGRGIARPPARRPFDPERSRVARLVTMHVQFGPSLHTFHASTESGDTGVDGLVR